MDPATLASIAISIASKIDVKLIGELFALLSKRASDAREVYRAKLPEELQTNLETNRRARLDDISELQTRAITSLSNQILLQRVVAVLLGLTAEAYEAKLEQELDSIRRRIEQLKSLLDRHDKDKIYRNNVRLIAVVVSVGAFILLFFLAIFGPRIGLSAESLVPVLLVPVPILLWSALGSFTSLVYRFNTASDLELQDPLRWLVTRPLTGIVMGTIAFLVVKVGFLTTASDLADSLGKNELIWLIAFLAGFSDRFSESILRNIVGKLGGDKTADFFSPTTSSTGLDLVTLFQSAIRRKPDQTNESAAENQPQPIQTRPQTDGSEASLDGKDSPP